LNTEVRRNIFQIDSLPDSIAQNLKDQYNIYSDTIRSIKFCFDKQVFLEYQQLKDLGTVHYINPGNPLFDSLTKVVRNDYREDMLKGTVLISPEDSDPYFAFFLKSQILDNRPSKSEDSIADERLLLISQKSTDGNFAITSPAKFIDLHSPTVYAKPLETPISVHSEEVIQWAFEAVTMPQFEDAKDHVRKDTARRKDYLESAFTQVITDLSGQINELQGKLFTDPRVKDKLVKKQERLQQLQRKKADRLQKLERMMELAPKAPEIMGCAWVVPLSQVEYKSHYGMSRDDEVEAIAMEVAENYEISQGWEPKDVSANNEGYDIKSISPEGLKRYIEVKGRAGSDGSVMVSENEKHRLDQLGDAAWLYIVIDCKSQPKLFRVQNPGKSLNFELKSKGVQYFLPMKEWRTKLK
jgi:hypothetical protein